MDAAGFQRAVVERIDPVVRPHGFPHDPQGRPQWSVLFHCQGGDLEQLQARWPGWYGAVTRGYGDQAEEVVCLDLWVERTHTGWDWSFEASDVGYVVGLEELERLTTLAAGDLDPWLDHLAAVLAHYFAAVGAAESPAGR